MLHSWRARYFRRDKLKRKRQTHEYAQDSSSWPLDLILGKIGQSRFVENLASSVLMSVVCCKNNFWWHFLRDEAQFSAHKTGETNLSTLHPQWQRQSQSITESRTTPSTALCFFLFLQITQVFKQQNKCAHKPAKDVNVTAFGVVCVLFEWKFRI